MPMTLRRAFPILLTIWAFACGDETVELGGRSDSPAGAGAGLPTDTASQGTDDTQFDDGDGPISLSVDGGIIGCTHGGPQCNNCVDDDGDTLIDGFDPQCLSSIDDDEASFITRIPGDSTIPIKQDCFFDGNSSPSDDGCETHICCVLGDESSCLTELGAASYRPGQCTPPSQQCLDTCDARVPPGCDCFGCCTLCADGSCTDVLLHPTAAANCTMDTLGNSDLCPRCTKSPQCGTECNPEQCIPCPGQSIRDLPPACSEQRCPEGLRSCTNSTSCAAGQYCANGCCIAAAD